MYMATFLITLIYPCEGSSVHMYARGHECTHSPWDARGVRGQLKGLVLSFHHWGSRDGIQAVGLGDVGLYPLSYRVRDGEPIFPFASMWLSIFQKK